MSRALASALWLLVALTCALHARAGDSPGAWSGTVVALADGDTVTVLDQHKVQHQVRLAAIDAPERGEPYARVARDHLAALVFRKIVKVRPVTRDRYGREVAQISVDETDVGLAMIRAGLAWHFTRYPLKDPEQRRSYEEAEAEARGEKRGLWALPAPEAPWDYRSRKREETTEPRRSAPLIAGRRREPPLGEAIPFGWR